MNYYQLIGFDDGAALPCARRPDPPILSETLLMLDFDGTLVEIADTPTGVSVPRELPDLLAQLFEATGGALALVSGRKLEDIERFLPDFPGDVFGTHGAERRADGAVWRHPFAGSDVIERLREITRAWARHDDRLIVEEKRASVVLHYRQAPDRQDDAAHFMDMLAGQTEGYMLHRAKMALELHPEDVSKKAAATWLCEKWPDRRPVAIGDDTTDEGMFDIAEARGGVAVRVGEGHTRASHCLPDPTEVRAMLRDWVEGAA